MDDSNRPPPQLTLWNCIVSSLEWLMAIVAIMACGMLFSSVLIPYRNGEGTSTEAPPHFTPRPPSWEKSTTSPPAKPITAPERIPSRAIDLPPLLDTSTWKTSSPQRERPFLQKLAALNFARPTRREPDYRLSGDDVPSMYEVHLSVRIRGRDGADISATEGRSRIHFNHVGDPSKTVELHAFGLYIVKASLSCESKYLVVSHHRNDLKQTLILTANELIERDSECVLELSWTGLTTTDNTGLYETWFTDEDGNISISLTTHGETMHTRKWMPCFDEPQFKVPFKLSIEHSSRLTALSNGPIKSIEQSTTEGRSTTFFEATWPIPTYLYAFSVTDYVRNSTIVDGLPVSVFVPSPLSSHLPKLLKDVSWAIKISLATFQAAHLNKKLDFIFFPDHSSAMENPGHISLGTDFLDRKDTLVHEMMHQYFGNLITLEWWSDLWINEGLANYYEDVAIAGNDSNALVTSLRQLRDNSMRDDVYDSSLPLHNNVDTFIESRLMFRNPYTKGAMVMNMLRDYMGVEDFDFVIETLLNEQSNKTLSFPQFYHYLLSAGVPKAENTAKIARDFLKQAGYPLLVVTHVAGATILRQVRFHRGFADEKQRDFDTRWTIPVHLIAVGTNYSTMVVIDKNVPEMKVTHPGILIVDPRRVVNYRVIYEAPAYEAISRSKLKEEDKDLIEMDLVEATHFGYADFAATYQTIMRRNRDSIVKAAHQRLMRLFQTDNEKHEETTKLLEKLSGIKLTRRRSVPAMYEHPLRQRRDKRLSDSDETLEESEEEGFKKKESTYCPTIVDMKTALKEYNKLGSDGRRDVVPLICILSKSNDTTTMKKWIKKLFDNHNLDFHDGDRVTILREIERISTIINFLQDYIVDELPKQTHYYKNAVHKSLHNQYLLRGTHLEQVERLIEDHREAAAENWVDISNLFERFYATKSEAEILGPKVIDALRKLTEAMEK